MRQWHPATFLEFIIVFFQCSLFFLIFGFQKIFIDLSYFLPKKGNFSHVRIEGLNIPFFYYFLHFRRSL